MPKKILTEDLARMIATSERLFDEVDVQSILQVPKFTSQLFSGPRSGLPNAGQPKLAGKNNSFNVGALKPFA